MIVSSYRPSYFERPPNYRIKLTVRPVTSLAKSASVAPCRPAAYAERWAE